MSPQAKLVASTPTIRSAAKAHHASELLADDRERASGGHDALVVHRSWTAPANIDRKALLKGLAEAQLEAMTRSKSATTAR
jgi:hypothetical protein